MLLVVVAACACLAVLVALVGVLALSGSSTPNVPTSPANGSNGSPSNASPSTNSAPNAPSSSNSLPPPSKNDTTWCKTWMSDPDDDGSCFALAYHHCVDGAKDESRIPEHIRRAKSSAMQQVYEVQKGCTSTNNGRVPQYKCFDGPPSTWTSVCVARPELAGKGKCKKVSKDEWRMWVQGKDPERKSDCQFSSLYVKSHFRGTAIQGQYTGQHGRG